MTNIEQISPDKYRVTNENTVTYSKTALKRDVEQIQADIEEIEKESGIRALRNELERKQSLINQMN